MSRAGYSDDYDLHAIILYRANVDRAIAGARGQRFLRELAANMDAMEKKELVSGELEANGSVCAIGVMTRAKGVEVRWSTEHDIDNADYVARQLDIAECMAREIVYENDLDDFYHASTVAESPADRWHRMRNWVQKHIY